MPFTAQDLIVRAAALGYGAIAITLHDAAFDPAPLAAFARQHGVRLLPGVERTIERAHVLLINFPAAAAMAVRRLEDIAALKAAHPHGLVVAPHPCYPIGSALGRRRLDAFAPLWDAIEVNALHVRALDWNRDGHRLGGGATAGRSSATATCIGSSSWDGRGARSTSMCRRRCRTPTPRTRSARRSAPAGCASSARRCRRGAPRSIFAQMEMGGLRRAAAAALRPHVYGL